MDSFKVPTFLHEVFGETQSFLEVSATLLFAIIGCIVIYFHVDVTLNHWRSMLAFLFIADVFAGCIANFTQGTNNFYAERPSTRLIFIVVHVHLLVIAWLLEQPLFYSIIVWAFTIGSAFIVNALAGRKIQHFIAANLVCYGLLLILFLPLENWYALVCIVFMLKVQYSFAVNHNKQVVL